MDTVWNWCPGIASDHATMACLVLTQTVSQSTIAPQKARVVETRFGIWSSYN